MEHNILKSHKKEALDIPIAQQYTSKKQNQFANVKVIVILLSLISCTFSAFSGYLPGGFTYKANYNGINYLCNQYALDPEYRTCIVDKDNYATGDVVIPSEIQVNFEGQDIICTVVGIDDQAFKDCVNLTSITIPNTVWALGYRSNGSKPDGDGNWVGSIEIPNVYGVFEGCTSLKTVNIPTSVQNIGKKAFKNCTALESIVIPESVTEIGAELFYNCSSLTSVKFSSNIENLFEDTFAGCRKLKEIAIPTATKIIGPNCFLNCSSLEFLSLPENLTIISYSAFDGCKSVKSIYIPSELYIEINFTSLFGSCENLEDIKIGENNPNYASVDGVAFNKEISKLLLYPAARTDHYSIPETVTIIDGWAFSYSKINSISLPNSAQEIGPYAFYHCEELEKAELPNSIDLIGEGAFESCSSLKSVNFPESIKSTGERAFNDYENQAEIGISNSVKMIGECAFQSCTSLKSIILPESLKTIGDWAFNNCKSLTQVDIPYSVDLIGECAFQSCNSLKSIILPESLKTIGDFAFCNNENLTEVIIPGSIEDFGEGIFSWCPNIKQVYYNTDNPIEADADMFDEDVYEKAILNVPPTTVNLIKNITPWNLFQINSGVTEIINSFDSSFELYSIDGKKIPKDNGVNHSSGIYLFRKNGETKKIMIKQ